MQLRDIFEEFNIRFFNHPVEFEDVISSDGLINSFELSYNPICDYDPYRPRVIDSSSGTDVELQENSDYVIEYEKGLIRFINIPPAFREGIRVMGFYQKCNLREFVNNYNIAIRLMQTTFPYKKMIQMDWDNTMATDRDESITSFDLNLEPFNRISKIIQIFQNKDDRDFIPFELRDTMVLLTDDHIDTSKRDSFGDYGFQQRTDIAGIKFPFFIFAELNYEEMEYNSVVLDSNIMFTANSRNQLILLLGRMMYETWLHKSTTLAETVLNINSQKSIAARIQSLDLQLYSDLRANFDKVVFPGNEKKIYNSSN